MLETFIAVLVALVANELIKEHVPVWYKKIKGYIKDKWKQFRNRKVRKNQEKEAELIKKSMGL